jgi:hypothetical protein
MTEHAWFRMQQQRVQQQVASATAQANTNPVTKFTSGDAAKPAWCGLI